MLYFQVLSHFLKASTFNIFDFTIFEKYFLKIGLISKIEHKDIAQKIINSVWNAAPSKEKSIANSAPVAKHKKKK